MRFLTRAGLVALGVLAAALPGAAASATSEPDAPVSVPVTFHVVNTNTSKVACLSDGASYDVVGHLTGPRAMITRAMIPAATLYLHGDGVDESLWTYRRVPGYDYATELANQGQVSVTITRLGYAGSGKPDGNRICFGSEADVTHQIIGALRSGRYDTHPAQGSSGSTPGRPISRIGLAGHSASGFVAMAEAYSYHDIDALLIIGSGDYVSPRVPLAIAEQQTRCASSGDGYALIEGTEAEAAKDFFHDADPRIVADATVHRPPDACGGLLNSAADLATDAALLGSVKVPVLVLGGAEDAFFPDPQSQAKLFSGSQDVTAASLPDTGHAITLGYSAPAVRGEIGGWLTDHLIWEAPSPYAKPPPASVAPARR
jgi:pimeloyl-ACP methyl ester carboxylesterase